MWWKIILVILIILVVILGVLYYFGSKMQRRQAEQQVLMENMAQTASLLIIDKKKMKLKEATGLPKQVYEQTPWYLRRSKVPVVKAKVGPRIMTFMCDVSVFDVLPVKAEVKVVISGLYISKILSVRGASIESVEKLGFWAKLRRKLSLKQSKNNEEYIKENKSSKKSSRK